MRKSLFARGFAIVVLAVICSTALVLGVGLPAAEKLHLESNAAALERAALSAASFIPASPSDYSGFCAALAGGSGFRATLVAGDGAVLADSAAPPGSMENHADRPEISSALSGEPGWDLRTSSTTGRKMLYAAVPVDSGKQSPAGGTGPRASLVLRLALPMPTLMEGLGKARAGILGAASLAILASLAASAILMRLLTDPVARLAGKALAYSASPSHPAAGGLPAIGGLPDEFSILERSLDAMASDLISKARAAENLAARHAGILRSAGEGIVAVDRNLRVMEANPAAHALLGHPGNSLTGADLASVSGSDALVSMARRCIETGNQESAEIALYGKGGRTLGAVASPYSAPDTRGAVIAMSDISVVKRLERVRTDFVANVSHELRTPIQLIKGFSETMASVLDGEGDLPAGTRAELARHLGIVEKHAMRMERIVRDLLSLARLEKDNGDWLSLEPCTASAILSESVSAVQHQAEVRGVKIETRLDRDFSLEANSGLMEQALSNLLENAVRYSPSGSVVTAEAALSGSHAVFTVRDRGTGIPAPDLERIFERFYRADKSRDRKSGGTGLGLAIVRHIAIAHGGEVLAESWAGEGSVFTLRVPLAGPHPDAASV